MKSKSTTPPLIDTRRLPLALMVLALVSVSSLEARAQTTAFTYQGRVRESGAPATGLYDFQFRLYDSPAGGTQAGGVLSFEDVAVTNGLFSVTLDFGDGVFTGADRWVETALRPGAETGAYATLSPRRLLASVPYAVQAANATTAASANAVAAANVTGTLALGQLPAAVVTNNASGLQLAGAFSGSGGGLTNLDAQALTGPLAFSPALRAVVHVNDGGIALGVAVAGNHAYLANYTDGLRIYDISNPASPVNVGHVDDGGYASGVAVAGNYAYLANYTDGLRIYDISNPASPVNVGYTNDGGAAYAVAVAGNYCYLANYGDGLRIYDVSNPASPVNVGHIDDGEITLGVAVAGNYCYLANYIDGLRIYDISNPASPVNVRHTNDGGAAYGVAVAGNYAYLANSDDGLRIYDVSNPASPVNVGHIDDGGNALGVAVVGNYCYLANHDDGLRIYNVSNPASPVNVGHIDDGGSARGVAAAGYYCYLANYSDGLRTYALVAARISGSLGVGGALGVGTITPQKRLEVRATSMADGIRVDGYGTAIAPAIQLSTNGTVAGELGVAAVSGNFSADATPGDFVVRSAQTAKLLLQNGAGRSAICISNNLVGIGKPMASTALDVNGTVTATAFVGSGTGLTNLNASQITSGAVPMAQLPAAVVTNNATAVTLAGSFTGNGAGLTNLDATDLTGTIADTRLSAKVPRLDANQTFTGTNTFSARLGVGATDIDAPLSVSTEATYSGNVLKLQSQEGPNNYYLLGRAATGSHWVSWNFDQMNYSTIYSNVLVFRGGSVGVGTDNPQKRLEITARGTADGLRVEGNGFAPSVQLSTNGTVVGELGAAIGSGQFGTDATPGDIVMRSATGKVLVQNGGGASAVAVVDNMVGIRKANPATALDVNGTVTATVFAGDGSGLTSLDASRLTGTVSDARLSTNVALLNDNQVFTGVNRFSGATALTNAANTIAGTFAGNGSGITNLPAGSVTSSQLASGAVAANLAASGQSAVPVGGMVLSSSSADANLTGAGYSRLGRVIMEGGWERLTSLGAPSARRAHASVAISPRFTLIWGGRSSSSGYLSDGMLLEISPEGETLWNSIALPTAGKPSARAYHTAVWTGSEAIIWGGCAGSTALNTGARCAVWTAGSWDAVTTTGAPAARYDHTAVWTGTEMIIWGGYDGTNCRGEGARYNPSTGAWTPMPAGPSARYYHTAVWTGTEMIIWGGYSGSAALSDGARYSPTDNTWTPLSSTTAPQERCQHTAVWTGSEMVIWGGRSGNTRYGDGARYNPGINAWTAMNLDDAPQGRIEHTAVWMKNKMVVFGGWNTTDYFNDALIYTPERSLYLYLKN